MKNSNIKEEINKAEIEFEKKQLSEQFEIRLKFDPINNESKWFKYRKAMLSYLDLGKNDKILDYGSATCEMSEWLAWEEYDVTAIDISYDLLAFSKKRDKSRRLKYACMDCEELAFKDESFDKIICFEILHHLPNPEKGIEEMYRILKGGGENINKRTECSQPCKKIVRACVERRVFGKEFLSLESA